MTSLAVDIVLLPPERIMDLAIEFNKELLRKNPPIISLNKKECLPHITLRQMVMDERLLSQAAHALQKLAKTHPPLQLMATRVETHLFNNEPLSSFTIAPNEELQKLHEDAMRAFEMFISPGEATFFDRQVSTVLREWVKRYPEHAFNRYRPHITLGVGEAKPLGAPHPFTTAKIAICHLGDYGTCRRILAEASLQGH
jgi:2'-5' RNA ligase